MLFCLYALLISLHSFAVQADPFQGFTLEITESKVLENLDAPGIRSFATLLGVENLEKSFIEVNKNKPDFQRLKLLRLAELSTPSIASTTGGSWYKSIRETIGADVDEFVKNSGLKMTVHVGSLKPTENSEMPRYFDKNWLTSHHSAFKLVAVVNRIDRMDFAPNSCGELRFIYRLGYNKSISDTIQQFSILPVFLNVVYLYEGTQCQEIAKLWKISRKDFSTPESFSEALQKGPLNKSLSKLKQIELNMQTVRFSSEDKVDFGGQAIYLFRIFEFDSKGQIQLQPLENTPDVTAILANPTLQEKLFSQLEDPANFESIDRGTFQLKNSDGKLLATKALSFSTVGRARIGNKPFSYLFTKPTLERLTDLPFAKAQFVKSPRGLVERMNNMSCIGCHQSNGTAGFHILGRHLELDTKTNRTAIPFSPHFYAEKFRKASYLQALVEGQQPNSFRAHSMYPVAKWVTGSASEMPQFAPARAKELCLEADDHFSEGIPCENSKLSCVINARNESMGVKFGECMFQKEFVNEIPAGFSCREGTIQNGISQKSSMEHPDLPFNFFSFNDKYLGLKDEGTPMPSEYYKLPSQMVCGKPKGGVPVGRIRKACEPDTEVGRFAFVDKLLEEPNKPNDEFDIPSEICAVRGGSHIDACAATNNLIECLKKAPVPRSMLDTCRLGYFCREDYLCQQLPLEIAYTYKDSKTSDLVKRRIVELNRRNIGFCVPNYFVFNMRIDGHPLPK